MLAATLPLPLMASWCGQNSNAFSFERGTHFRNSTLFFTFLPLFFSIPFFRPLLYFPLPFSFFFFYYFFFFVSLFFFWLPFIPFLVSTILFLYLFLSYLSLLMFSVHFLCSFLLLPLPVFTSPSTHHIAPQTKCVWLLRSPLLPNGHVLDSAIWVALYRPRTVFAFSSNWNTSSVQTIFFIEPVECCANVLSVSLFNNS